MRLLKSSLLSLLLAAAGIAQAASSWSFDEASISVSSKGDGAGVAGFKDKYVELLNWIPKAFGSLYSWEEFIKAMTYPTVTDHFLQTVQPCSSLETSDPHSCRLAEDHLDSNREWQAKTTTPSIPTPPGSRYRVGNNIPLLDERHGQGKGRSC